MKEKVFEERIKDYLSLAGAYWVKYHGEMYSTNGTPDILACVNGHFLAIEVKGDGGRPSALQREKIADIHRAGGLAYIVWPSGWDAVKRIIDNLRKDEYTIDAEVELK